MQIEKIKLLDEYLINAINIFNRLCENKVILEYDIEEIKEDFQEINFTKKI
jgi:hypothetical protein